MHKMSIKGKFHVEHYDKHGNLKGKHDINNGIVTAGFNKLFDVMFGGVAAIATWYIGLINNSGFVGLASTDLMSSHPGWTELQDYTQATRPAFTPAAAAAQVITSSAVTVFTMNTNGDNIKGMFLTSVNTKGGATGTLWCTGLFSSVIAVNSGDSFKVIYTLSGS